MSIAECRQVVFDTWCNVAKVTMLSLPKNWNSYGAPPIDETIVDNAILWLRTVKTDKTPLPKIVPTVKGGVQLEWHFKDGDVEVTFGLGSEVVLSYEGKYFENYFDSGEVIEIDEWILKIISSSGMYLLC